MKKAFFAKGEKILSDSVVDEILGQGGMGVAYLAHAQSLEQFLDRLPNDGEYTFPFGIDQTIRQSRLNNELARFVIKVPKGIVGQGLDVFQRECYIWISLKRSPYVVNAFRVEVTNDIPVLLMEYIKGTTLVDWIGKEQLDIPRVVDFSIQICRGLCHIYKEMRIVHRDLKPSNILINIHNIAKVTDFGLASALKDESLTEFSLNRGGSLAYMAPEQFDQETDVRGDIYSFGVMLYEMLVGQHPFTGKITLDRIGGFRAFRNAHKYQQIVNPCELNTQVPLKLALLTMKCLEKEPSNRFPDFEKLLLDLEEIFNNFGYRDIIAERESDLAHARFGKSLQTLVESWSYMSPEDWWNKGEALRKIGELEKALSYFESGLAEVKVLEREGKQPPGLVWLDGNNNIFNFPQANSASLGLFDRYSSKIHLLMAKGICLENLRRINEASEIVDQLLELEPNLGSAVILKSLILKDRQDYWGAISLCDQVIKGNPNDEWAWHNKGNCLGFLGRFEEALSCFEKALSINPFNDLAAKARLQALTMIERKTGRQMR